MARLDARRRAGGRFWHGPVGRLPGGSARGSSQFLADRDVATNPVVLTGDMHTTWSTT